MIRFVYVKLEYIFVILVWLLLLSPASSFAAGPGDQTVKNIHGCIDNVSSCTNESAVKNAWSQAMSEAGTVTEGMYRFLYDIFSGTKLPELPVLPGSGPLKQATTPSNAITPTRVVPQK